MRGRILTAAAATVAVFLTAVLLLYLSAMISARSAILPLALGALVMSFLFFLMHSQLKRDIALRQRAVTTVRECERRYRELVDGAHLIIVKTDTEGKITFANRFAHTFFGYSEDEMIGSKVLELISPASAPIGRSIEELMRAATDSPEESLSMEHERIRRNGEHAWVEWTIQVARERSGQPTGLLFVGNDITERKRVEEELRLTRFSVDRAAVSVFLIARDAHLLYVNDYACRSLGYTREELLRMTVHDVDPNFPASVWDAHWADLKHSGSLHFETLHRRKDGSLLPVEVSINYIAFSGKEYNWAFALDISERKRTEDELRRISRQSELILESAGEGIFGLDIHGDHTFINAAAAEMLGYEVAELIGKFSHSTWHYARPDRSPYPVEECKIYGMLRDGNPVHVTDEVFWKKDGSSFPVEYTGSPIIEGDTIVGAVVTFRDITERRQAEEALQQANKNLSNWVAELEQRNREIETLSEMSSMLQACTTADEAYMVIERSIRQLFPAHIGTLYLLDSARNILESIISWGELRTDEQVIGPRECWALRLGRPYSVDTTSRDMLCSHVRHTLKAITLCIPIMSQSETLGMLHLEFNDEWVHRPEEERKRLMAHEERLATTVVESIGLSLANFRLRETLYKQSIHDPLTGLFNRRFMQEVLERELFRAERKGQSLGIIMLDIDHFKSFNDTYGHAAGDILLRELGTFMQSHIRGGDFACRYGGEEFIVILPETSLEQAMQRAEQLRKEVTQLTIRYHGQVIGNMTLSLGVSSFPKHGITSDELLRAADLALYRAKTRGRDQVAAL